MVGPVRGLFSLFAVLVFGAAAAAAGCGGEISPAREYRDQASALCRDALRDAEELGVPSSPRQLESILRDTLRYSRSYTERLEALEPPAELAGLHQRSTRLNKRAEELTEQVVDDLAAGGAPQELLPPYAARLLEIGKRDNELSRQLGLPDCVTPLPGPDSQPPAPA
jgi:hypothetical protein